MIRIRSRIAAVKAVKDDERGISLAELLVAMGILTVLLILAGSLFTYAGKISTSAHYASVDSGVATNVMNEASTVVRFGTQIRAVTNGCDAIPAVVQATPSTLMVYSYLSTDALTATTAVPELVLLNAQGGQLVETRWAATSQDSAGCLTYPSISTASVPPTVSASPLSSRVIGGPLTLAATGKPALFTYSDATGATVAFASGQVPSASLIDIAAVQLDVQLNTGGTKAKLPVHLQGSVSLQNPGTEF